MFVVDKILGDLEAFSQYLNDNKNLQFNGELDKLYILFLDLCLTGVMGKVSTSFITAYIQAQSGHPKHTIKGIPVGQFLQIRHICSKQRDFETWPYISVSCKGDIQNGL